MTEFLNLGMYDGCYGFKLSSAHLDVTAEVTFNYRQDLVLIYLKYHTPKLRLKLHI